MKRFLAFCVVILSGALSGPVAQAQSSDASVCKTLYRTKKYTRAARCFFDLAKQWEKKQPATGQSRAKAGGFLRNASLCYRKAAKAETTPHKQAYLRERAMLYIRRILTRKLYESPSQKRLATHIKDKLQEAIGYAQVTVMTSSPQAKGKVSGGYRFPGKSWRGLTQVLKLRPGAYTIVVDYGGKASKAKVLKVAPGQAPMVLDMKLAAATPPPRIAARVPARRVVMTRRVAPLPAPKPKVVPWVLIGVGGAALVTGVILTGVAFGTKGGADQKIASLRSQQGGAGGASITDTNDINAAYNSANAQLAAGLVVGGVGLVTTTIGLILVAR